MSSAGLKPSILPQVGGSRDALPGMCKCVLGCAERALTRHSPHPACLLVGFCCQVSQPPLAILRLHRTRGVLVNSRCDPASEVRGSGREDYCVTPDAGFGELTA